MYSTKEAVIQRVKLKIKSCKPVQGRSFYIKNCPTCPKLGRIIFKRPKLEHISKSEQLSFSID